MQCVIFPVLLLCLSGVHGLKIVNPDAIAPSSEIQRASVEFVPPGLRRNDVEDDVESVECNNEPVDVFDGSAFSIQRSSPFTSNCTFNFQVQPGVAVDLMCTKVHVPCRRNVALIISSSASEDESSICTENGVEKDRRVSIKANEDISSLQVSHSVRRRRNGQGFSCIVRGLGGAQAEDGGEERVDITAEADNSTSSGVQSRSTFNCGRTRYNRIINGGIASNQEYPWMVALVLNGGFCGGSLINDRWILTAAHCSIDVAPSNIRAYPGCQSLRACPSVRSISRNVIPIDYNFPTHDIALLQLSRRLTSFSDSIRPVCLASSSLQPNTQLSLSGWGRTEQGGLSSVLKEAQVATMDDSRCRWLRRPYDYIVCTRTITGNSCNGDSGSPLVYQRNDVRRFVQYALVSFGQAGCSTAIESGNTELPPYINFIRFFATTIETF